MAFTDIFIKKPVVALTICVAFLVMGAIAYMRMPVRQFPVIDVPLITITTAYPGASPQLIEGFVSTPIEQAIAGVQGIDYVQASNEQGVSDIQVWLKAGSNDTRALTQISSKVNSIIWKLPKGIRNPVIVKASGGSATVFIALGSNTLSKEALTDYANRVLLPQYEGIKGVNTVQLFGKRPYAMRVWLNPSKMAAHNVTAIDAVSAVANNSLQAAIGRLRNTSSYLNLQSNMSLNTPEEFNQLVVKADPKSLVRLKDIGYAALGAQYDNSGAVTQGSKNAIFMGVVAQPTANNIEIAKAVKAKVKAMRAHLPAGMNMFVNWDASQFSVKAVQLVYSTIWQSVLCVVLVIFIFLGSFRALLIPIVTIPLSLIGVCALMMMLGFSLNTLTLLAFVLAIGLVVDDSIVVLENIHRHMHLGKPKVQAAMDATREIMLPVIAMTLVVAVVFIPIALRTGITGSLFREFALTMTLTVLLSGVFSLILSPMMCSRVIKVNKSEKSLEARVDYYCDKLANGYKNALTAVLRHRMWVLAALAGICFCGYGLLASLHTALLPQEDQGVILGIGFGPSDASIDYMAKIGQEMSKIIAKVPEMQTYGVVTGFGGQVNRVISFLIMRDHQKGDRSEDQIIAALAPKFAKLPSAEVFPMNRPPLIAVTGFQKPVQFVLQTTGSYLKLNHVMQELMNNVRKQNPNILNMRSDLTIDKPQIYLHINRDRAARLGVSMQNIAETLGVMMSKPYVGWFSLYGRSYPVIPQAIRSFRQTPADLKLIYVRSDTGKLVSLSNLVSFKEVTAPASLNQFQQLRSAMLTANLAHGYTIGQASTYLQQTAKKLMTNDMKYDFAGTMREFVDASGQAIIILLFSLVAVYLMLSAKFNSFVDPIIVMVSVPLSLTGALLCMHFTGATLDIYTKIGLFMLIGLISKHGILIVNFANHLQEEGYSIHDAVVEAAKIRLRPILMTTGAMVFGTVPLVLASGMGSVSLREIGTVIIGGLSFGSLLTLFAVPTIYTFLATKVETDPASQTVASH